MKTLKFTTKIIGILIFTTLVYGFVLLQQQSDEELIVGTWVSEEGDYVKMVFTEDGLQYDVINGISDEISFNWQIYEVQVPSGLTISYLTLTNTQDANEIYKYEINTLDEERLILVYQRGKGWGIGKLATYLRQ